MKQKRSRLGCLFWVALILLVIVVFLFNKPQIERVLTATGLTKAITGKTPHGLSITRRTPATGGQPQLTKRSPAPSSPSPQATKEAPSTPSSSKSTSPTTGPKPVKHSAPSSRSSGPSSSGGNSRHGNGATTHSKVIHQKFDLYFVTVTSNGATKLTPVKQTIIFVDEPLTKTFHSLLTGVSTADKKEGIRTLIPKGTKLLDAAVKNGTAYLNFNDQFRFNAYGVEGYKAQLEQVVYTATQFPTVKRVQILLNGKVRRFLSPEGITIAKPLDRASFSG